MDKKLTDLLYELVQVEIDITKSVNFSGGSTRKQDKKLGSILKALQDEYNVDARKLDEL